MKRKLNFQMTQQPKRKEVKMENNLLTGKPYSNHYYQLLETRLKLPATAAKKPLLQLLNQNQTLILIGQTGSGKTTQIPQFLIELGYVSKYQYFTRKKAIACTQPRRVAAMSVAKRVSQEMDVVLGEQVGYSIRFQDKSSSKTLLKYMTDGMLLRQAMKDSFLSRYGVIILDQAHQRTLNTDVLFGLIKQLLQKRKKDLKLIVMSATMQAQKFQNYFNSAPLLSIPGRTFPVQIFFALKPENDYVEAAVRATVQIHLYEEKGDILLFLTGQQQIEGAIKSITAQLESNKKSQPFLILPLYSTLPPNQQQRIFEKVPKGSRKIIVATNIAQTSITIDGIIYVIDPGFSKQKVFNPRMRVQSLLVSPISKASAKQRAGRAGRTQPGKCFRLYTQESFKNQVILFNQLIQNTYPEILRSNLAPIILMMKKLGIDDLVHFDFMDPPAPETLMRALQLLNYLGAIDDEAQLTDLGKQMAQFPLQPQLSKVLLTSNNFNVTSQMLTIVSCLNCPNIFLRPKQKLAQASNAHAKFSHPQGDHISLLNAFNAYIVNKQQNQWVYKNYLNIRHLKTAKDIREQLKQLLKKMAQFNDKINPNPNQISHQKIRKCLLTGFFTQIASLQKNNVYMTIKDSQIVAMHPSTFMTHKPQFVLYNQLVLTKKNFIRTICQIKGNWLFQVAPNYFKPQSIKHLDTRKQLKKIQQQMMEWKKKKEN